MIWRTALALASRRRLSILIFHRVLERPDPLLPGEPSAEQFDALLKHIASRFNVLPLAKAAQRLYDGTLPQRALVITFDDGYANNLSVAAPILQRHGLPATVFISTGYLDGRAMWNDGVIEAFRACRKDILDLSALGLGSFDLASHAQRRNGIEAVLNHIKPRAPQERERIVGEVLRCAGVASPSGLMLCRSSVAQLERHGVDVGAHTVTHPILARAGPEEAWREIRESKRELEDILGRGITLFAYPNGRPGSDYTHEHVAMVREAGFRFAVTTAPGAAGPHSDPLQLPRFTPWSREPLRFDLLMLQNLRQRAIDAPAGRPGGALASS